MPKRGEKGFTLIELLIVVAILGVLAAIVIPNVGRFIGPGESEAAATELENIQNATLSMMTDQGLDRLDTGNVSPQTSATSNMSQFPDANAVYVLYGFDAGGGETVNYVATETTKGTYTVDVLGTVNQTTTGYE
jgi:type IV pilus assembly protein PilA